MIAESINENETENEIERRRKKRNVNVDARRVGKGPRIQHIYVGSPLNDERLCKSGPFVFFALYARCIYRFKWPLEKAVPCKMQCSRPTDRTNEQASE